MIVWSMTTFQTLDLKRSNAWKDVDEVWSMTTFQALDLKRSNAWKDADDSVEHDHFPGIRYEEIQCLEGCT